MKNILLLGGSGFVGATVKAQLCQEKNNKVHELKVEITKDTFELSLAMISDAINVNSIDVVVNCIAKANLDECEDNPHLCELINKKFVQKLVDVIALKNNVKLVHISSNAVYGGGNAPYNELSKYDPINFYGVCKAQADTYIQDKLNNFVIVRPITVYGPKSKGQRDNPVSFIIKKLISGEKIKLVDDNIVNMIHVDDLKLAIEKLTLGSYLGVFNISGDISESRYDLGVRIANQLNIEKSIIEKVNGKSFIVKAKRPFDTSFDNNKMKKELKIIPRNIDLAIKDIFDDKSY